MSDSAYPDRMDAISDRDGSRPALRVESTRFAARFAGRWHAHPEAQLIYPSRGVMVLHARRGQWVVPPSQACWLPADLDHKVETSHGFEMRSVYCRGRILSRLPSQDGLISVSPLLREIILALETAVDRGRLRRLALIFPDEVALKLSPILLLPRLETSRLERIAAALASNPADDRTIEAWAAEMGLSSRTLTRLFHRETGMSFTAYRNQVRLKAALLGLATGASVTAIGLGLGYGATSDFIKAFKGLTGLTPGRYFQSPP